MVLNYWHRPSRIEQLIHLLRISAAGASFRNLLFLKALGVEVSIFQAEMTDLSACLSRNIPPIVFVDTGELAYWPERTAHAVVVIGMDEEWVYFNDPAFSDAPKQVSLAEFDLAWLEMDQYCAIITG
jgi:ABC-type bacteriocin/lantibiotic exporter with double-glycine peptidase domain